MCLTICFPLYLPVLSCQGLEEQRLFWPGEDKCPYNLSKHSGGIELVLTYSLVVGCYRYCGCIRKADGRKQCRLAVTPTTSLRFCCFGNFLPTIEWAELLVQFVPVLYTKLTVLGRPGVSVIMVATDRKITLIFYADFTLIFDDWNGPEVLRTYCHQLRRNKRSRATFPMVHFLLSFPSSFSLRSYRWDTSSLWFTECSRFRLIAACHRKTLFQTL